MFLTAPVWWFYLYWVPSFLHDRHGLDLLALGPPLVVIYLMTASAAWAAAGSRRTGSGAPGA